VIPELTGQARCLAPDLIGMGRSGKPGIAYRFADHARYLDAWFEELELDGVTLVGHDWGGALGFDWASRHPGRVRGIAFMETIVHPITWDDWPEWARGTFQAFRRPGEGEELILDRNLFVEQVLPNAVLRTLSEEELDTYRTPFTERASRLPTLAGVLHRGAQAPAHLRSRRDHYPADDQMVPEPHRRPRDRAHRPRPPLRPGRQRTGHRHCRCQMAGEARTRQRPAQADTTHKRTCCQ
jgi:pimeloyl-ACP methyl ester carboxylesterase